MKIEYTTTQHINLFLIVVYNNKDKYYKLKFKHLRIKDTTIYFQ
jgi:hypothetical protein